MEDVCALSKSIRSIAIGASSNAIEPRQIRGLGLRHQLLNSFVHMGPYLDLESALMTSNSSDGWNFRLSAKSSVEMTYHAQDKQQDCLIPGVVTTVGEYVTPRRGGGCDHRSRQLEAGFVKGFKCCQLRLDGMHDLLDQ